MYIINLSQDHSKWSPYLSQKLLSEAKKTLDQGKKVILYLNKRAAYSGCLCESCGAIERCESCDISLHVHNNPKRLVCHACGYTKAYPNKCETCGKKQLKNIGFGTQHIEEIIKKVFIHSHIFRFDTDNVGNKQEKQEALSQIEKADIIIGTKMITTGFNFQNIGMIGVILIEQELMIPAYNTEERLYSNIKQLIGRGNRKGKHTDILIQTFIPENDMVQKILNGNYKDFFLHSLEERRLFLYPPFGELAHIEYNHKDKESAQKFIQNLYQKACELNTNNELYINISPECIKKSNKYYYKIILRGKDVKDFIQNFKGDIFKHIGLQVVFH